MDNRLLKIGELAKRSNTTTKTLRYYERIGLLAPATRGANRYRLYPPEALGQVRFIRRIKRMGLSLDEVAELIDLVRDGSPEAIRAQLDKIIARRIRETETQIRALSQFGEDLKALRRQLEEAKVERCNTCGAVLATCDCQSAPKAQVSGVRRT